MISLGSTAPDFYARTNMGDIQFHEWLGSSWYLLFSHPEDYTPVCTTELGVVANLQEEFEKRDVKAIALSVDSLESHKGWIKDIEESMKTKINFPIIADEQAEVAQLYGMIHKDSSEKHTIRSVFVIGPEKDVKLMLTYPMAVGRNFDEILRVVDALQLCSKHLVVTPANWEQKGKVIIDPSLLEKEAEKAFPMGHDKVTSYLRYTNSPVD
ncbi:peroxiredoxin [Muricauda sp. JGD-17]|uniref:Thioredoxin peroxidase n=1 Tax=Flagellimonas ochracea TaxID=2696472 RepID=A0A964TAL0_9FLAO|nr:peroxiredoxin [Allomuricauda ochracea]NAY91303.1 peroxiredoxin [Allomuricauda ochracea]